MTPGAYDAPLSLSEYIMGRFYKLSHAVEFIEPAHNRFKEDFHIAEF